MEKTDLPKAGGWSFSSIPSNQPCLSSRSGVLFRSQKRLCSLALVFGLTLASEAGFLAPTRSALAQQSDSVQLRVRKQNGTVEIVIAGAGSEARIVEQQQDSSSWRGRLRISSGRLLRTGSQQLSMPDAGLKSIQLDGSGSTLNLLIQADSGVSLSSPRISSNGEDLIVRFAGLGSSSVVRQTGQLDLRRPGRVAQPTYVPPMQPRAVAPPVGDMAVGTMLINNRSFVNVTGPPVTLTLNNAPAKDALMSLARLGGYGFVYVGDTDQSKTADTGGSVERPVSMAFRDERFDRALNSVLMASGLQGKLDGRTLLVGTTVAAKTFGPQMSKVFRLNQVPVEQAANYLANLGALISITNRSTTTDRESESTGTPEQSSSIGTSTTTQRDVVESYGASSGPLIGLNGTTDARLGTITLVGDPSLISVAESYLKQLDLRKRQVAVKVQILSVRLTNSQTIDSSFSARMGDTFVVSQNGNAHLNFGRYKPGNTAGTGVYDPAGDNYGEPGAYQGKVPRVPAQTVVNPVVTGQQAVDAQIAQQTVNSAFVEAQEYVTNADGETELVTKLDDLGRPIYVPTTNPNAAPQLVPVYDSNGQPIYVPTTDPSSAQSLVPVYDKNGQPVYVPTTNPATPQTLKPVYDKDGRPVYVPGQDPAKYRQPDNSFYAYIESVITSGATKTLSQPTLLVQEGEKAKVEAGTSFITGVSKNVLDNGNEEFVNTRENAGLTVILDVLKIDDNGFVTINLKPEISVSDPAGQQEGVPIYNIAKRTLDTGNVRLRDGQSLILTGVIQETDSQEARKWPVLGDIPILGQLFRSSSSNRFKDELVIIVTPTVIDDEQGGTYGYGYRPATPSSRQLLRTGG